MTGIVQPEDTQVTISERAAWHAGAGAAVAAFFGFLVLLAVAVGVVIASIAVEAPALIAVAVALVIAAVLLISMVVVVAPGHTLVVQLFGKYVGTVRNQGLASSCRSPRGADSPCGCTTSRPPSSR
ncbi:hypothetical protein MTP03_43510 [Tsukamurella sp. PLM1]|nr:hypothetical protein MTP03_43510 [Tsukamurella sp. PLM1]